MKLMKSRKNILILRWKTPMWWMPLTKQERLFLSHSWATSPCSHTTYDSLLFCGARHSWACKLHILIIDKFLNNSKYRFNFSHSALLELQAQACHDITACLRQNTPYHYNIRVEKALMGTIQSLELYSKEHTNQNNVLLALQTLIDNLQSINWQLRQLWARNHWKWANCTNPYRTNYRIKKYFGCYWK